MYRPPAGCRSLQQQNAIHGVSPERTNENGLSNSQAPETFLPAGCDPSGSDAIVVEHHCCQQYSMNHAMPSDDNLIWIDCEMTGLDTERDSVLEMATIITDK